MIWKTYDEIQKMPTEEIRCEMLQIWHDIDFNNFTEEEEKAVTEQLKIYKDTLRRRHYNFPTYRSED